MWKHYYMPQPSSLHYVCYPESCGRFAQQPEHRVSRPSGMLMEYNLHLIASGRGYVTAGGERHELGAGSGFLYRPGESQEYGADPDDPWDVLWVHFTGNGIESMLSGFVQSGVRLFALTQQRHHVEHTLTKLIGLSSSYESAQEPVLAALLYETLATLLHDAGPSLRQGGSGVREKMLEAADYIRSNCAEPLTLKSIAAQAGYSPYHFTRIFHDTLGKSPMNYLTESRILLAKRLLVSTPLTIKQVAYESGFSQDSYFISIFRRTTGMTPRQFREVHG